MAGLKDRGYDFTRTGPTVQMHVWYLQGRRRAVTGLGPFLGQSGATGAGGEEGAGACLGCRLPSTRHSPLVPGRGLLGQGWEGRDPLCHPPHAPLTPTQLSCLCSRMHPEGALLGRPHSALQTLVGWEPPGPRGGEGGDGFRTRPGQVTSPRAETCPKSLRTAPPKPLVALAPPPPVTIPEWGRGETAESGQGWG